MAKTPNPAFPADMMKMFDPENIAKMFNPEQLMAQFSQMSQMGQMGQAGFDLKDVIDRNQKNYEGMVAANQAAAEAYKDLLEKQMEIFGKMTANAQEQVAAIAAAGPSEAAEKQAEIYQSAIDQALKLMAELSDASRKANEDAFAAIQGQVEKAMADLKKG